MVCVLRSEGEVQWCVLRGEGGVQRCVYLGVRERCNGVCRVRKGCNGECSKK